MVILFFKDPYKLIRNIRRDLDRGTLDECPVVGEDLISDPDDPVCLVDRIVVIDIEFTSQIKEENLGISLNISVRISNDDAFGKVLQIEQI